MLLLLGCAVFDTTAPGASPEERLDALVPGLAAAVAGETDRLEVMADLAERSDPALLRLLLPAPAPELYEDRVGEQPSADLRAARAKLDGDTLRLRWQASGTVRFLVDAEGGPDPDLRLTPGENTVKVERLRGWTTESSALLPAEIGPGAAAIDRRLLGLSATRPGAVVASACGSDDVCDYGPAGVIGVPEPHAVHLWVAMAAEGADDPDLLLAVALAWAPWRAWAQDRALVEADARARLAYGLDLDDWLAERGADWRLGSQPPVAKLLWAWPGGEAVVYGALPLAWAAEPLSREAYRFHVPSVEALETLRDDLPFDEDLGRTADTRDERVWDRMTYRAADAGMEALCEARSLSAATCFAWERDRNRNRALGEVDGRRVPMHLGNSVELQLDHQDEDGDYVGDCLTATTLAGAALQAVGIVPLPVGYAGPTWYWPTHNFPVHLEVDRFVSPQAMPSPRWSADATWAYAVLPVVDPYAGVALGWEPDGWARGGSVAAGAWTYGALGAYVEQGVPIDDVAGWVDAARTGWPELR